MNPHSRPADDTSAFAPTLFAFHHAGGSATAFAGWRRALSADATVVPVRIPRPSGGHLGTPQEITALAAMLNEELAPLLEGPHLFYGHSMGALIAYHLTRQRAAAGLTTPLRLVVGAFPAPHLPNALRRVRDLPDRELAGWLTDLSGLPAQLLEGERLRTQIGLLRHDLAICATHRFEEAFDRLPCPVDAFVGEHDPIMSVAEAAAWQEHSAPGGTSHVLPAGHFFTRGEAKRRLFGALKVLIAEAADRHGRGYSKALAA